MATPDIMQMIEGLRMQALPGPSSPSIAPSGGAVAPSGQIGPFSGRPINPADVTSVRDVPRTSLPGSQAGGGVKPSSAASRIASGLVKGGIIGGLASPNTMGDATLNRAGKLPIGAPERPSPQHVFLNGQWIIPEKQWGATEGQQPQTNQPSVDFTSLMPQQETPSVQGPQANPFEVPYQRGPMEGLTPGPGGLTQEAADALAPSVPTLEERRTFTGPEGAGAFTQSPNIPSFYQTEQVDGGSVSAPPDLMNQTMGRQEPVSQAIVGTTLNEYIQGGGTQTDPQGRMITPGADRSAYEREAAAREARIEQRPDFGQAVSDRERRGTGEMSMAEATRLTGGDRDAARAMIERQRQGMGQFAEKQDTRTPEEIEQQRLRNEFVRKRIEAMDQPNATPYQKRIGEFSRLLEAGEIDQEEYEAAVQRAKDKVLGVEKQRETKKSPLSEFIGGDGNSTAATQEAGSTSAASTVQMIHPNGTKYNVPANDVEKALEAGYTRT